MPAGAQQRWLDGWMVRFSPGKAKRARCVNAVADGRSPLADRIAACARLYEQAQLPLIVRITPFTRPADLDAVLEQRGLSRFDDTRVMVLADLASLDNLPIGNTASHVGITIESSGLESFAHRVGGFRGSPLAQRQAHAERLLDSPVPFFAFEVRDRGSVVACGQFALEDDLVGLYDVFTSAPARGRGIAGLLCKQLLAQARSKGARHAYLQVEGDNHAARAVYHRLGFLDGYAYHYRTWDPATA